MNCKIFIMRCETVEQNYKINILFHVEQYPAKVPDLIPRKSRYSFLITFCQFCNYCISVLATSYTQNNYLNIPYTRIGYINLLTNKPLYYLYSILTNLTYPKNFKSQLIHINDASILIKINILTKLYIIYN